jgi:hypothetical protein
MSQKCLVILVEDTNGTPITAAIFMAEISLDIEIPYKEA